MISPRMICVVVFGIVLAATGSCGRKSSSKDQPQASALSENAKTEAAKTGPGGAGPGADCDDCRKRWCMNPELDLVTGCFEKPDPKLVPNPDPKFAQDCKAVVECAYKNNCAYDRARGPAQCYCGSRKVAECAAQGPADDAPCVKEWTAATRGKTNMEVLERYALMDYPSGWAFALIQCDRDRCGVKSKMGRCIP